MGLERRHHQQDFAVERERWRAPFQRFLDVRDGGVDALADMLEDRPGERRGLGDIGVDPRVGLK